MVEQFVASLTGIQLVVVIYLVVYLVIYGVKYHLLAVYACFSGRSMSTDIVSVVLNYTGYAAIACCVYWFV